MAILLVVAAVRWAKNGTGEKSAVSAANDEVVSEMFGAALWIDRNYFFDEKSVLLMTSLVRRER